MKKLDMTHDEVGELLPWYANGTLAADEREAVDEHLTTCHDCREELAFLQDVDATATSMAAAMPAAPDSLAATFERIDAFEASAAAREPQRGGLVAWFADLFQPGAVRWALAAQMAVILVLGGLLLMRAPEPEFVTLSGGGATGAVEGTRLTVMFVPDATEAGIRTLLTDIEGTLVSGPSAAGVYVVSVPVEAEDAAAVDAVVEELRAASDVVRFAEREP